MVKINERYDDVITQDPAYDTNAKPVDAVNKFLSDFLVDPVTKKLKSKEQALLEVGEIVAKPFNILGQALDTGKTVSELQNIATTDPGLQGLVAQAQVVPQAISNTLNFIFEPEFYSGLREKINRGEATGFERGLGIVSAIGEIAGGDELLRFAIKKFGPGIKPFFDNLRPEEKADPIAVINKMPISKQQKVELGEEILGGGKAVERVQETIMREPDTGGGSGGPLIKIPKTYQDRIDKNLKGSEATQAKVKKALDENPTKAPKAISQFSKDYGMEKYDYLLTEIYKRQSEGTLPLD